MKKILLMSLLCSSFFMLSCDKDVVSDSDSTKNTSLQYESPFVDIIEGTPINITFDIGRNSKGCKGIGFCNVRPASPTHPELPPYPYPYPGDPIIVDFPQYDKFEVVNVIADNVEELRIIGKHNVIRTGYDGFVLQLEGNNIVGDAFIIEKDLTSKELPFTVNSGEYQYNKKVRGYVIDITRK